MIVVWGAAALLFDVPAFLVFSCFLWKSVIGFVVGGALIGLLVSSLILNMLITWPVGS